MDQEPMWFFNSNVLSSPAYALYRYLLWAIKMRPKALPDGFIAVSRADLQYKMGWAYNSVQSSLSELVDLGLIEIDPHKTTNKNLIRLKKPDEFNHVLIKQRLFKAFNKVLVQSRRTSKYNEGDDEKK